MRYLVTLHRTLEKTRSTENQRNVSRNFENFCSSRGVARAALERQCQRETTQHDEILILMRYFRANFTNWIHLPARHYGDEMWARRISVVQKMRQLQRKARKKFPGDNFTFPSSHPTHSHTNRMLSMRVKSKLINSTPHDDRRECHRRKNKSRKPNPS